MFVTAMIIGSLSIPPVTLAQPAAGSDLTFTVQDAPSVIFSHNNHLKKRKLKCSRCHYQYFQMAKGSYKMDMGKITKGKFCGRCHNGRASFDVRDPKNCSRCHRGSSSSIGLH